MASPVKPTALESPQGWEAFRRLKPAGILDSSGEVLERVDGPAFLTLISAGANLNNPDRPAIQIGVLRLLRDFVDRLDPLDVTIAQQAIAHSGFLDPPRERPPAEPGALPIRVEPAGTRRAKRISSGGGTVLWVGGVERRGPSFVLREMRALQASDGRNIVWEVGIGGEVPSEMWRAFIHTAWDLSRYGGLLNGAKLLVHFIGSGKVLGGEEVVREAVVGHLATVSEVVLRTSAPLPVQPFPKPSEEELRGASEKLAQVRQ